MATHAQSLVIETHGRGFTDLTRRIDDVVQASKIKFGVCHLWIAHTSASLIVCENADPSVKRDLEAFFERFIPDGDARYEHADEGPDDMPAHIRSVLTQTSLSIPIRAGRCACGTWHGIYLWEHRHAPHRRRIEVTLLS